MNTEIPPRSTTAPTAIAIAPALLRPLVPDVVVVTLVTAGAGAVVTVGVVSGTPGDRGLLGPCARAVGAAPSAQPAKAAASAPNAAVEKRLFTA